MSATPTSLLCRTGTLAAAAALMLALPATAMAKDKDKDHGKGAGDTPAACADAKQSKHPHGGAPGLTKKADEMPECRDIDEQAPPAQHPADPPMVVNITNVTAPAEAAPAAAPVSAAASSSAGKCEKRRVFRMTLHKGRARTASVKLNGRAIRVTKGKRKTSVLVNTRGRKNTNFTVRYTVVTKKGRLKTGTRRFRTCG